MTRYTYNKFNQQTEAKAGGVAAKYAYNARGIRTSKVVGPTTTYYLLDGDNVIGEVQSGSVSVTYLRGANLIRKKVGSTLTYYEFHTRLSLKASASKSARLSFMVLRMKQAAKAFESLV